MCDNVCNELPSSFNDTLKTVNDVHSKDKWQALCNWYFTECPITKYSATSVLLFSYLKNLNFDVTNMTKSNFARIIKHNIFQIYSQLKFCKWNVCHCCLNTIKKMLVSGNLISTAMNGQDLISPHHNISITPCYSGVGFCLDSWFFYIFLFFTRKKI